MNKDYCEIENKMLLYKSKETIVKEHIELLKRIDKAIKLIEDTYYSKNTTDIDSIVLSNNKLLRIRKILKEVE